MAKTNALMRKHWLKHNEIKRQPGPFKDDISLLESHFLGRLDITCENTGIYKLVHPKHSGHYRIEVSSNNVSIHNGDLVYKRVFGDFITFFLESYRIDRNNFVTGKPRNPVLSVIIEKLAKANINTGFTISENPKSDVLFLVSANCPLFSIYVENETVIIGQVIADSSAAEYLVSDPRCISKVVGHYRRFRKQKWVHYDRGNRF